MGCNCGGSNTDRRQDPRAAEPVVVPIPQDARGNSEPTPAAPPAGGGQ